MCIESEMGKKKNRKNRKNQDKRNLNSSGVQISISPQKNIKTAKAIWSFLKSKLPNIKALLYKIIALFVIVIFKFFRGLIYFFSTIVTLENLRNVIYFFAALATIFGGIVAYLAIEPRVILSPSEREASKFDGEILIENNSVFDMQNVIVITNTNAIANISYINLTETEPIGNIERGENSPIWIRELEKSNPSNAETCVLIVFEYFDLFSYPSLKSTRKLFRGFFYDSTGRMQHMNRWHWIKASAVCDQEARKKLEDVFEKNQTKN